jgi:hypothetical protein
VEREKVKSQAGNAPRIEEEFTLSPMVGTVGDVLEMSKTFAVPGGVKILCDSDIITYATTKSGDGDITLDIATDTSAPASGDYTIVLESPKKKIIAHGRVEVKASPPERVELDLIEGSVGDVLEMVKTFPVQGAVKISCDSEIITYATTKSSEGDITLEIAADSSAPTSGDYTIILESPKKKIIAHGRVEVKTHQFQRVQLGLIEGNVGAVAKKTFTLAIPVKGTRAEIRGTDKVQVLTLAGRGDMTDVTLSADSSSAVDVPFTLHVSGPGKTVEASGRLTIKGRIRSGQASVGSWGDLKASGTEGKPTEIVDIGSIDDRATKKYKLPVSLEDADVDIEAGENVRIAKVEEGSDGFVRVTVAVESRYAVDEPFTLVVTTPDKIMRCEGRAKNLKPVESVDLGVSENKSTMMFRLPLAARGAEARIERTKQLRVTKIQNVGDEVSVVTVCCDEGQPLHSTFKLIVESPRKIVIGKGRVEFTPKARPDRLRVRSKDLSARKLKGTTYKITTSNSSYGATEVLGQIRGRNTVSSQRTIKASRSGW